jgi:hypothetical protein
MVVCFIFQYFVKFAVYVSEYKCCSVEGYMFVGVYHITQNYLPEDTFLTVLQVSLLT